jgi:anaerobic dimethyl sulfoxide reductase subunit C (anchor subunit)
MRRLEMAKKEWPLIAFTLLSQTAVGFFLLFTVPLAFSGTGTGTSDVRLLRLRSLFIVLVLLAAAVALSFFHLGKPFNAYRALNNVRTSRLSREIFFELLLIFLIAVVGWLEWRRIGSQDLRFGLYLLAALAGVGLIWSMAGIYRLEAVPVWNNAMTPFSFFMTTFILGALGSAAAPAFKLLREGEGAPPFAGRLPLNAVALTLLALNFIGVVLFDPNSGIRRHGRRKFDSKPSRVFTMLFGFRLAFLLTAAAAAVLSILAKSPLTPTSPVDHLMIWAFVAALISETLGRILFYALFRKEGL